MNRHSVSRGFSLVEVLVVLAIVALLAVLLLPAIQTGREASRRGNCQSNLRQVGLALQSFEDLHRRFPIGSRRNVAGGSGMTTYGVSWWAEILPQLEETGIAGRLDVSGLNAGWVALHPQNGQLVHDAHIGVMFCPSSPVPKMQRVGGFRVGMPAYVGISGAMNGDGFVEPRVSACCAPKVDGEISAGGMLIPNLAVQWREMTDGASYTLLVGETSDYGHSSIGNEWRLGGGFPLGWLAGTLALGTPPNYDPTRTPAAYNITTMRYSINTRDYDLPGIEDNRGANNPLVSAHPGGAMALFVDGSARFLTDDLDVITLKRMATRDDGVAMVAESRQ